MPPLNFTAKEVNIIVQAIRIAQEPACGDVLQEYAKKVEIEQLRNKLQKVKDL